MRLTQRQATHVISLMGCAAAGVAAWEYLGGTNVAMVLGPAVAVSMAVASWAIINAAFPRHFGIGRLPSTARLAVDQFAAVVDTSQCHTVTVFPYTLDVRRGIVIVDGGEQAPVEGSTITVNRAPDPPHPGFVLWQISWVAGGEDHEVKGRVRPGNEHVLLWALAQVCAQRDCDLLAPGGRVRAEQLQQSNAKDRVAQWVRDVNPPHHDRDDFGIHGQTSLDEAKKRWNTFILAATAAVNLPLMVIAALKPDWIGRPQRTTLLECDDGQLAINGRPVPNDQLQIASLVPVHDGPAFAIGSTLAARLDGSEGYDKRVVFAHDWIDGRRRTRAPTQTQSIARPGILAAVVWLIAASAIFAIGVPVATTVVNRAVLTAVGIPLKGEVTEVAHFDAESTDEYVRYKFSPDDELTIIGKANMPRSGDKMTVGETIDVVYWEDQPLVNHPRRSMWTMPPGSWAGWFVGMLVALAIDLAGLCRLLFFDRRRTWIALPALVAKLVVVGTFGVIWIFNGGASPIH